MSCSKHEMHTYLTANWRRKIVFRVFDLDTIFAVCNFKNLGHSCACPTRNLFHRHVGIWHKLYTIEFALTHPKWKQKDLLSPRAAVSTTNISLAILVRILRKLTSTR